MAIAHRSDANQSASGNFTLVLPSGVQATDILVLVVLCQKGGSTTSGSYVAPSGWNLISANANISDGSNAIGAQVWWAPGNVPNLSFTAAGAPAAYGATVTAFTGVNNSTPVDVIDTWNGAVAAASVVVQSINIMTGGAWELIAGIDWLGGALTAGGFTATGLSSLFLLYNTTPKGIGSTGTVTVSDSGGSAGNILAALAFALKPVAAPPDNPPPRQGSQRFDPLPDHNDTAYRQHKAWPVPVEYIPTPPPTRQASQDVRSLPVFDSWWEQFRPQPVPVTYLPSGVNPQRGQRQDPLPDHNDTVYRQHKAWPVPTAYLPPPPPTYQPSQRWDAPPDLSYLWWEQHKAPPFHLLPLPSYVQTGQAGLAGVQSVQGSTQEGGFRSANDIAGYCLYLGVGAYRPPDGNPDAYSKTLPLSIPAPPPVSGTLAYYTVVTARDQYGLESTNQQATVLYVDSAGNPVLSPVGSPQSLALSLLGLGRFRVSATYPGYRTDADPASRWRVWVGATPPDPTLDTPTATVSPAGPLLSYTAGPYAAGTYYVAVALYRASDGGQSPAVTGAVTINPPPSRVLSVSWPGGPEL